MTDWNKVKEDCLEDLINLTIGRMSFNEAFEIWFDRWFCPIRSDRPDSTAGDQWGWKMRKPSGKWLNPDQDPVKAPSSMVVRCERCALKVTVREGELLSHHCPPD